MRFLTFLLPLTACAVPCVTDTAPEPTPFTATGDFPYDVAQLYCTKLTECDPGFFDSVFLDRGDCIAVAIDIATHPPGDCVDDPAAEQPLLDDLMPGASCNKVFANTGALTLLLVEYGICVRA